MRLLLGRHNTNIFAILQAKSHQVYAVTLGIETFMKSTHLFYVPVRVCISIVGLMDLRSVTLDHWVCYLEHLKIMLLMAENLLQTICHGVAECHTTAKVVTKHFEIDLFWLLYTRVGCSDFTCQSITFTDGGRRWFITWHFHLCAFKKDSVPSYSVSRLTLLMILSGQLCPTFVSSRQLRLLLIRNL